MSPRASGKPPKHKAAKPYKHPEAESPMRPEVGTQAQFKKKMPPKKYRYDDSLSPVLEWDGQNPARERGEARIAKAEAELAEARKRLNGKPETKEAASHVAGAQKAIGELRAMSKPFLNWAGKAERLSFDVPTLPLFIHERLSTKAILDTLKGHRFDRNQTTMFDLFGDPQHSITDQVLRAYEHRDKWVNRMILGDSLVVMNSLLHYESLGGQVQMIYMDPPYGVKFGSNFQPFVRQRNVSHNDDADMTREPEMVQAYRDTWTLGLHTYLTYLRDRLVLARALLHPSGSIFVQISDENVHHVREIMDDVFDKESFLTTIVFQKTSSEEGEGVANTADYLLWYCRDKTRLKSFPLYREKQPGEEGAKQYVYARRAGTSETRRLTPQELAKPELVPDGWIVCRRGYPLTSQDYSPTRTVPFVFEGKSYSPGKNRHWSVSPDQGLPSLVEKKRIYSTGESLSGIMDLHDMPGTELGNVWMDTGTGSFTDEQIYVVQTSEKAVQRCILMTTEPGDLVLDPTCGSGTTAYCAESLGRRWVTVDTSRVPLALARQRLLSATFPYFSLSDESRGPISGFVYETKERTKNKKGDGFGVAMQHTLSSIAGDEPAAPIIFRDNPEREYSVVRVTGPFCVEATIPTPADFEEAAGRTVADSSEKQPDRSFVDRMIEVLRKSPALHLEGNRTVALRNVRPPAKSLSLSAEALVDATAPGQRPSLEEAVQEAAERNGKALPLSAKSVALVFGPENGAVNQGLVYQAAIEAAAKKYTHLYVTGFAIEPNARELIEKCDQVVGIPATYVQATPDLMMGDLLKNMRSSQVFSVCGMPEAELRRVKPQSKDELQKYEVELFGLDVFDPTTMEVLNRRGDEVPAWFLDTDYNGLCFHVSQAFFPKTGAWENLKKALSGDYEETVWDHLAGTVSAPFEAGDYGQVAVKVIDERGNELLIVKPMSEARK
jgi:adenine-specific DNA-methyltransferase